MSPASLEIEGAVELVNGAQRCTLTAEGATLRLAISSRSALSALMPPPGRSTIPPLDRALRHAGLTLDVTIAGRDVLRLGVAARQSLAGRILGLGRAQFMPINWLLSRASNSERQN